MMATGKKRSLKIVVAAVVCAVFLSSGSLLWAQWQSGEQEIADSLQNLDQLSGISTYAKTWKSRDEGIEAQASSLFLPQAASTIVEATLLASIKEMAGQQAVEISRTSSSPTRLAGGLAWHDVTVDVTGTSTALIQFITTLERSRPALFVERLQIQSNVQPGVMLQQEPVLSAELTISGATKAEVIATGANPP
jgi:Type II secretion system (T2SS), protein M subtype b